MNMNIFSLPVGWRGTIQIYGRLWDNDTEEDFDAREFVATATDQYRVNLKNNCPERFFKDVDGVPGYTGVWLSPVDIAEQLFAGVDAVGVEIEHD